MTELGSFWPFEDDEAQEDRRPKFKRIISNTIRSITWFIVFVTFCFLDFVLSRAARKMKSRKGYKKKIIDFGLFDITVYEKEIK